MNIGGISGSSSVGNVSSVNASSTSRKSSIPPAMGAGSASISKPAELLSKLKQLEQTDPAKFKQVVTQLSSDLKTAAGKATGAQADFLNKMADGFAQAATTGDLSAMQPPQGGPPGGQAQGAGHHHHHHHGGGAPGGDAVQAAFATALSSIDSALGATSTSTTSQDTSTTAASAG